MRMRADLHIDPPLLERSSRKSPRIVACFASERKHPRPCPMHARWPARWHAARSPVPEPQGETMNRRDLVAELADRIETDKRSADAQLQAFIEIITETVAKGEAVAISGFAKFARVDRAARMGRNPQTGEPIQIKASRRARITPLKAFKDAVLTGKAPTAKKS